MTAHAPRRFCAAAVMAALPWLNPFASGPSPAVQPWLLSVGCALALWLMVPRGLYPPRRLVVPCAALLAWAAVSQLSLRPEMVMLAGGLALICISASLAADGLTTRALLAGMLSAAAVSAVFGLVQYFGISAALSPWVSHADAGEAFANLRQPNQYTSLCWIGVAILIWSTAKMPHSARVGLITLLAVGSAASVSRTGVLQGLTLTVLSACWPSTHRQYRLKLCAVAAVAYFAAAWALPLLLEATTGAQPARTLWGRFGNGEPCSSRLVLWSNVLRLIAKEPFIGWGWGELDYAHYATLYGGPRFCDILDNAHSLPLHVAVELGIPAAVVVFAGGVLWAWRQRPWQEEMALRQLAWAIVALILLHSLLEYPLWYGHFQIAFGVSLGWLLHSSGAPKAGSRPFPHRAIAALLLAATGYAAWDYHRVSQIYLPAEERAPRYQHDALGHARRSWLFANQARFAELTITQLTRSNAAWMLANAEKSLHYSPEPRVVEKMVESAALLGRESLALVHLARYQAAFPEDYEAWAQRNARPPQDAR